MQLRGGLNGKHMGSSIKRVDQLKQSD